MHADRTHSPNHSATLNLSGALGIVLVPDQATIEKSYQLAEELLPSDAEYVLRAGSLPHLTLYHGMIKDLPAERASAILESIRQLITGAVIELGPIVSFGGNFVFWNVRQLDERLRSAHASSLAVTQYLDRTIEPKSSREEGLSLTPAQTANLREFGHPLVRDLFAPHITLGFQRGIAERFVAGVTQSWRMTVSAVELVRVGYPGRVEEVL